MVWRWTWTHCCPRNTAVSLLFLSVASGSSSFSAHFSVLPSSFSFSLSPTGLVQLTVQIVNFRFQDPLPSHDAPLQLTMDSSTPLDAIQAVLGGDVTFSGCGRCSTELDTDLNGIYVACYACLPHTSVRRYYR